jgi:hypothetical protein
VDLLVVAFYIYIYIYLTGFPHGAFSMVMLTKNMGSFVMVFLVVLASNS